jgi:hypothetical protein
VVDYRIGDLPSASTLGGTEETEIIQAAVSRRLSLNGLWTWLAAKVQLLIDTALLNSIEVGDAAGGDLTGTYPNPTLAALVPSPSGSYLARDYTMVVDAKGRVLSMALSVAPSLDAVLYTTMVPALDAGEQLIARSNIDGQRANTRLSAAAGIAGPLANSLIVWDNDGAAHQLDILAFMESVLAAPDAPSALTALGGSPAGFTDTIRVAVDYAVQDGDETIIVDASANTVDIDLPVIDAAQDGRRIVVKARDVTFAVAVNCDAADDIDGAASVAFPAQYQSYTFVASYDAGGSFWSII